MVVVVVVVEMGSDDSRDDTCPLRDCILDVAGEQKKSHPHASYSPDGSVRYLCAPVNSITIMSWNLPRLTQEQYDNLSVLELEARTKHGIRHSLWSKATLDLGGWAHKVKGEIDAGADADRLGDGWICCTEPEPVPLKRYVMGFEISILDEGGSLYNTIDGSGQYDPSSDPFWEALKGKLDLVALKMRYHSVGVLSRTRSDHIFPTCSGVSARPSINPKKETMIVTVEFWSV